MLCISQGFSFPTLLWLTIKDALQNVLLAARSFLTYPSLAPLKEEAIEAIKQSINAVLVIQP